MLSSRTIRRCLVGFMVLAGAAALILFDVERRRRAEQIHSSAPPGAALTTQGPQELAQRYEDQEEFHRFCKRVHEKYLAMNARFKALQHRRRQRSKQMDKAGGVLVDESLVEIVDFPNGQERHRKLDQKDMLTGLTIAGESELQKSIAAGKTPFQYPFLPESTWDDFAYRFGGVETVDGKPVVRVDFTPNPPFDRKTVGTIWADAESGQPVRFAGRWYKPTGLVHKFEMNAWYGLSENGFHQIRRVETDGSGGALFVYRRYAVSFDADDYRAPDAP